MKRFILLVFTVSIILTTGLEARRGDNTPPVESMPKPDYTDPLTSPPQVVEIQQEDQLQDLIKKAASLRASDRQLAYHQLEFTGFIHYGINTFTRKQWGSGKEDPKVFNPETVDTDQWCRLMKENGMKMIVITLKHHEGFCLWQTRYNDKFSVQAAVQWMDGKGDVMRMLVESARKYDMKIGVYLSPADLYQMNEGCYYGNRSEYRDSVIPTDPATFQSDPLKQRPVKEGLPTFKFKLDDYNRYMMNQLYEVLTEYGPIHEVWFDGAHPKHKGGQKYVKYMWYRLIRKLQPEAVIFHGLDVRWCGNEGGKTRQSEWNAIPVEALNIEGYKPTSDTLGDEACLSEAIRGEKNRKHYLAYLPSEVDTSIRHGWFWGSTNRRKDGKGTKEIDEIFDIYERAVGTGAVLLLNVPPTNKGVFDEGDVACLKAVGQRIRNTYGTNLAEGAKASVENLLDNDIKTFWQMDAIEGQLEITLPKPVLANRFVVQEAISEVGQRVKKHALDAFIDGNWKEICQETTIGYKRILRFDEIKTDRFRLRILDGRDKPAIAGISIHQYTRP